MAIRRDDRGRFYSAPDRPDQDTFVTISNEKIYEAVQNIDRRLSRLESHLDGTRRIIALIVPTVTAVAGFASAVYYVHH